MINQSWKMPLAATAAAALVSACATYVPPADGAPSAELTLQFGAGTTRLQSLKDASCADSLTAPQIAQMGQLWDNTKGPVRIAADRRIFLLANSLDSGGRLMTMCTNLSSFVPSVGHSYGVVQTMRSRICELHVVDLTTSRPPETLVVHPPCK